MTNLDSTPLEPSLPAPPGVALFGHPRDYLGNRFVYIVISQRARGLSIGVNLTPDRECNFNCIYCEVDRDQPVLDRQVDLRVLATELDEVLKRAGARRWNGVPWLHRLPGELLELKEVALSGDGEPTLCPCFKEVVETVVHRRARERRPFKLVLITNTSGLQLPAVDAALRLFASWDEVWVKLDAGTQAGMDRINQAAISLDQVLENILALSRLRPVVIQSLFPQVAGAQPPHAEIEVYIERLRWLKAPGSQITLVQVYSAHRPAHRPECDHLPLRSLSRIAHRVREVTGLRAEVF